jgi:N-hydroxyarylamine O-acetyltransferase
MAEKVLGRNRGGFCLELNTLLGTLLQDLGFQVTTVPGIIYRGADQGGFDHPATHIVLIVTTDDGSMYFVDVGLGEPPLHPLEYKFDEEQITPEGMQSRLIEQHAENVVLEWFKDGEWQPRLQWDLATSLAGVSPSLEDLKGMLELAYQPTSRFSRKLIVCRMTRDEKTTQAGTILKRTASPRFGLLSQMVQEELGSIERMREVLQKDFGIPHTETQDVDIGKLSVQDASAFASW